ncbi:MAG: hypothetical protein KY461_11050 [Actinobacteria bacterium]|nr:hypothetical protein [Actinomycetota bacterium]
MRRIRRSTVPILLAGTLLLGAAACGDDTGGQDLEEEVQTEDTGTGATETGTELEDPLTGNTGTETESTTTG